MRNSTRPVSAAPAEISSTAADRPSAVQDLLRGVERRLLGRVAASVKNLRRERSWYSAKLLFECIDESAQDDRPSFHDESVRVIWAESPEQARRKAHSLGLREQHGREQDPTAAVKWRFVNVLQIEDLGHSELTDGAEVSSRIVQKSAGNSSGA